MNKIILLGHSTSGLLEVEALLLSSGMQQALPSKRDNLDPTRVVEMLCQAHHCPDINEGRTEDDFVPVKVGPIWNSLALDLMLGNLQQPIWGWADSRNIYWLDYWSEVDPYFTFVMVYDHPTKLLQEMSAGLINKPFELEISRLLENWQAYNGAMLRFYWRHPSRCLLVNSSRAREQLQDYLVQLGKQIHNRAPKLIGQAILELEISEKAKSDVQANLALAISEVPELPTASICEWFSGVTSLDQHLLQHLLQAHPISLQIFEELEAASTVPSVRVMPSEVNPSAAWFQLIQQRKAIADLIHTLYEKLQQAKAAMPAHKELEEENNLLLKQMHLLQEELERNYYEKQSSNKNQNNLNVRLYGAAERIQQQLTYRLGATLIANSRSVRGWLRMPWALYQDLLSYRLNKNNKRLESLQSINLYADKSEAERYKQHLSYKLGEAFLKYVKTPWGWFVMPFALFGVIKKFRQAKP